jgi:hypothetical protein
MAARQVRSCREKWAAARLKYPTPHPQELPRNRKKVSDLPLPYRQCGLGRLLSTSLQLSMSSLPNRSLQNETDWPHISSPLQYTMTEASGSTVQYAVPNRSSNSHRVHSSCDRCRSRKTKASHYHHMIGAKPLTWISVHRSR